MFDIKFDKQPLNFLTVCQKELFERIKKKCSLLSENPVPHDAKLVVGYQDPTFRLRIGKYRALYRIDYGKRGLLL